MSQNKLRDSKLQIFFEFRIILLLFISFTIHHFPIFTNSWSHCEVSTHTHTHKHKSKLYFLLKTVKQINNPKNSFHNQIIEIHMGIYQDVRVEHSIGNESHS